MGQHLWKLPNSASSCLGPTIREPYQRVSKPTSAISASQPECSAGANTIPTHLGHLSVMEVTKWIVSSFNAVQSKPDVPADAAAMTRQVKNYVLQVRPGRKCSLCDMHASPYLIITSLSERNLMSTLV